MHKLPAVRVRQGTLFRIFTGEIYPVDKTMVSSVNYTYTGHETFDIGRDEGMPVNEEYADKGKFKFTEGQLHKVVFDIE